MWSSCASNVILAATNEIVIRFSSGLNHGIFNKTTLVPSRRVDVWREDDTEALVIAAQTSIFIIVVSNRWGNVDLVFDAIGYQNGFWHPVLVILSLIH